MVLVAMAHHGVYNCLSLEVKALTLICMTLLSPGNVRMSLVSG